MRPHRLKNAEAVHRVHPDDAVGGGRPIRRNGHQVELPAGRWATPSARRCFSTVIARGRRRSDAPRTRPRMSSSPANGRMVYPVGGVRGLRGASPAGSDRMLIRARVATAFEQGDTRHVLRDGRRGDKRRLVVLRHGAGGIWPLPTPASLSWISRCAGWIGQKSALAPLGQRKPASASPTNQSGALAMCAGSVCIPRHRPTRPR